MKKFKDSFRTEALYFFKLSFWQKVGYVFLFLLFSSAILWLLALTFLILYVFIESIFSNLLTSFIGLCIILFIGFLAYLFNSYGKKIYSKKVIQNKTNIIISNDPNAILNQDEINHLMED
jgi:positive regulator of sigma E activity